ncbi:hypothetical protein Dimus_026866 [Dionaea muscipula]
MHRGTRGGGVRIAHDDEEEFDNFRFPMAFQALISWLTIRGERISEKIAARQHARLQGGGVVDAPPIVPPPPAHVPAPAPVPAQFS